MMFNVNRIKISNANRTAYQKESNDFSSWFPSLLIRRIRVTTRCVQNEQSLQNSLENGGWVIINIDSKYGAGKPVYLLGIMQLKR